MVFVNTFFIKIFILRMCIKIIVFGVINYGIYGYTIIKIHIIYNNTHILIHFMLMSTIIKKKLEILYDFTMVH